MPAHRRHFSPPNGCFGGFGSFHPRILPQSLTDKNTCVRTVPPFNLPWSRWASATSGCICRAPRRVVWLPRCTRGHRWLCTLPYSNHLFKGFWSMSPFTRAEGGGRRPESVCFIPGKGWDLCSPPAFPSAATSLHSPATEASYFLIIF